MRKLFLALYFLFAIGCAQDGTIKVNKYIGTTTSIIVINKETGNSTEYKNYNITFRENNILDERSSIRLNKLVRIDKTNLYEKQNIEFSLYRSKYDFIIIIKQI